MTITINKPSLEADNLTLDEFIYLLVINEDLDLDRAKSSLISRGLIDKDYQNHNRPFTLTSKGTSLYNSAIINAENYLEQEEESIKNLATTLKELYPKGKKDGTSYYWAEGVALIIRRLKLFYKKYGKEYTNEQIIDATKRYIQSFNGNYKYMKLLKYFILKEKRGEGGDVEGESDLLTYIENASQATEFNNNWTSILK